MSFQSIDIDWDIHRAIEAERKGFDEPPYIALRRLLGLSDKTALISSETEKSTLLNGLPWTEDGVQIPHGSLARMKYNHGRQHYEGAFLNGQLVVNGMKFDTLSAAASTLAVTKSGGKTQLNGWLYWEVKLAGQSNWQTLASLREKVRR
jgi:hypothetical protein